jgi:hypothetical protein
MTTTTRPRATSEEVARNCRQIRDAYADGRRILRRLQPKHTDQGNESIRDAASALGQNEAKAYKARQFAQLYSRDDMEALCDSISVHEAHFGIAHLGVLVSVSDPHERAEIQQWCIENDASKTELEAELKLRRGSLRRGGRRRRVGSDPDEVLVRIEEATDTWSRFYLVISEPIEGKRRRPSLLERLPDKVRKRLLSTDKAMRRLHKVVVQELKTVRGEAGLNA